MKHRRSTRRRNARRRIRHWQHTRVQPFVGRGIFSSIAKGISKLFGFAKAASQNPIVRQLGSAVKNSGVIGNKIAEKNQFLGNLAKSQGYGRRRARGGSLGGSLGYGRKKSFRRRMY